MIGAAYFFPSTFWTSRGMTQRPAWIVKHFWCSYPLKSPGDIFLLLRLSHKFVKPQRMNPQRSRNEIICKKMNYLCLKCFWFQSLLAVYTVIPEIRLLCKNFRGCWELYANVLGQNRHEAKAKLKRALVLKKNICKPSIEFSLSSISSKQFNLSLHRTWTY